MKEVQVFLLCDTCHENGDRREAVERTVSVDGQTAVVAACEEHMAPIVDVLAMIALGVEPEADRPVKRPRAKRGEGQAAVDRKSGEALPTDCELCTYQGPTRSALGQHLLQHHKMNFTQVAAMTPRQRAAAKRQYALDNA